MFASAYGWTVADVLNLTFPEIFKLQESMLRRLRRMGQVQGNDGNINWDVKKSVKKIHDALDDDYFGQFVVEE